MSHEDDWPGPERSDGGQPRRRRRLREVPGATWRWFVTLVSGLWSSSWVTKMTGWLRKRRIDNIIYTWLAMPILWAALWLIGTSIAWMAWGKQQQFQRWMEYTLFVKHLVPGGWNLYYATGWFWAIMATMAAISIAVWRSMRPDNDADTGRVREGIFHASMVTLTVGALALGTIAVWDNDKDSGNFNNRDVQLVIQDLDHPPDSLAKLFEKMEDGNGEPCDKVSGKDTDKQHDTVACVTEGSLDFKWEDRIASANAASIVLGASTIGTGNTYLMEKSVTYLYGDEPGKGEWSGIRDGKGKSGAYAIVRMDRNNNISSPCTFTGHYKLHAGFAGSWSWNLRGMLAAKYPTLRFDNNDVWGYCTRENHEPVIVILPTKFTHEKSRATLVAGGVITVRGSEGGTPKINHYPNVGRDRKVDELTLPGPVYPSTLAAVAREDAQWMAGRDNRRRGKFGFDPGPMSDGDDNVSEHLRRELKADGTAGVTVWQTPLTSRANDASTFNAWSAVEADHVREGERNTTRVYVYNEQSPSDSSKSNPAITVKGDLTSRIKDTMGNARPGYFTSGGVVREFIPREWNSAASQGVWIAFGEIEGRVKYRIEISTNRTITPTIVDLDSGQVIAAPEPRKPGAICFDPTQMTSKDAGRCLAAIADALGELPESKPGG